MSNSQSVERTSLAGTAVWRPHRPLRRYAEGIALVAGVTLVNELISPHLAPTNLIMLYLLVVVVAAYALGRGPSILVSTLSVLAFDFFFVPPVLTFDVENTEYLLTFAGLLVVSLVISQLSARVRQQAEAARNAQVLEATEKLQTALLNSISHDLRTPLVSVTGALSTLADDGARLNEDTRRELVETARGEAERLNRLVGDLLDMTRIQAGALRLKLQPSDVQGLIGSALESLNDRLKQREVRIDVAPDLPLVPVDPTLIIHVLVNVIDNALKYSPAGSHITISAGSSAGYMEIAVSDRGIGIPSDELERVFDKFYRAQHPGGASGTGLGLSICKGIVEAHGGTIRAAQRPGGGAVLSITLPLDAPEPAAQGTSR